MTDLLVCTCDHSPHSAGPDQGCPQHGDVRWYAQMWAEANDHIAALTQDRDSLRGQLADLQQAHRRRREQDQATIAVHRQAPQA